MRKLFLFAGIACLALGAFGVFFVPAAWLRFPLPDAPTVRLEIPQGATIRDVADLLVTKKLLSSPTGYRLYAVFDASATRPKAGFYDVKPGMSYKQLARMFALGPMRDELSMTVIEGWTIFDIQSALRDKGIDVLPSDLFAERFTGDYPFLKNLPVGTTLEGYLFPDTYRVWKDQLPDGLIRKQLDEFSVKTAGFDAEAASQGRTFRDVIILASIVEKEVRRDEDRAIVAGIFMNRLKDGMRLQSDATLNYVIRSGRSRLTSEDLKNESPYNTYVHAGLPPGPIGNPGKSSLDAALFPKKTDFRYFLTDSEGKTYFAKTLEEHIRNRQKAFGG